MSSDTSGKPTITGLVLTYNGERAVAVAGGVRDVVSSLTKERA